METSQKNMILLVDDEIAIRELMRLYLENLRDADVEILQSQQILEAGDLPGALKHLEAHAPDISLIIMDWRFPAKNQGDKDGGTGLVREIIKLVPDAPCIVMSGYHDFSDEDQTLFNELRIKIFMQKPFNMKALKQAIMVCRGATRPDERTHRRQQQSSQSLR